MLVQSFLNRLVRKSFSSNNISQYLRNDISPYPKIDTFEVIMWYHDLIIVKIKISLILSLSSWSSSIFYRIIMFIFFVIAIEYILPFLYYFIVTIVAMVSASIITFFRRLQTIVNIFIYSLKLRCLPTKSFLN